MILRMGELIPAFARGAVLFQDAIHGPRRTKILAFIEQRGADRGRRAILEAFGIQDSANGLEFLGAQRPGRSWPGRRRRRKVSRQGRPEQGPLPIEADSIPTVVESCRTASIMASPPACWP